MWDFQGKHLLRGETDGSSYPNGGLRATHRAGAYLTIDATSPIFLRGDVIFIPSCMVTFEGKSIDEKIPLLRASDAVSREGSRLLTLLGRKTSKVIAKIGLEQELFLIPRDQFNRRPDLQMAGRTVVGRQPPRGQEMSDHCKRCLLISVCVIYLVLSCLMRCRYGTAFVLVSGARVYAGNSARVLQSWHSTQDSTQRSCAQSVRICSFVWNSHHSSRPESHSDANHRRSCDKTFTCSAVPRETFPGHQRIW